MRKIATGIVLAVALLVGGSAAHATTDHLQAGLKLIIKGNVTASKYKTTEVTVLMDYNDVQLDGAAHDIMPLEPIIDKWKAFGFAVLEINGHNVREVLDALDEALEIHSKPTVIVAHTTKGKGVSYMENRAAWHGAVPNEAQYKQARAELLDGRAS